MFFLAFPVDLVIIINDIIYLRHVKHVDDDDDDDLASPQIQVCYCCYCTNFSRLSSNKTNDLTAADITIIAIAGCHRHC